MSPHRFLIGLLIGCLLFAAGCSAWIRPSELRPPAHPLLAATAPRPTAAPIRTKAVSAPKHANIARRAEAAIGRRATTDRTLLATVFEAHPLASADSATAVWRNTRARRSSPKRGDLLVFLNDGAGPQVAVVLSRDAQGLEAAAVTRGAVRRIRVDPKRPNTRRRGKKVVNTFLRPRRSDDSAKTRYLAGARLLGVRSY